MGGVCRGRLAALRRAHATSAEDLREGLAGLHRRVVAEPRRCVPRPLRRGRLRASRCIRSRVHRDVVEGLCAGCHGTSLRCGRGRLIETSRGSMSRPLTHSCGGCQEPAGGAGGVAFDGHLTIVSGYQSGLPARHERLPTERQRARSSGGSRSPRATVRGLVGASRGCRARTNRRREPPWQARSASSRLPARGPFGARRAVNRSRKRR